MVVQAPERARKLENRLSWAPEERFESQRGARKFPEELPRGSEELEKRSSDQTLKCLRNDSKFLKTDNFQVSKASWELRFASKIL